jgi:hypothetical protein
VPYKVEQRPRDCPAVVVGDIRLRTKCLALTLLGGFVYLLNCPNVSPATIGPRCGSCYGATSALTEYLQSSIKTTPSFQVKYIYSPAEYVHQVAVKISRNNLVSLPLEANWALHPGLLSSLGCSGSGANFICASGGTSAVASSSSSTWVFDIPKKGSASSTESIRANYDTANIILSDDTPRPDALKKLKR